MKSCIARLHEAGALAVLDSEVKGHYDQVSALLRKVSDRVSAFCRVDPGDVAAGL
jgi:hypothetical protein